MNTPVSFELAKLLKEKGFDKRTSLVWLFSLGKTHLRKMHLSLELNDAEYNAPTIAEVVMWLYEKHEIWIYVPPSKYGKLDKFMGWIIVPSNGTTRDHSTKNFNSPTEAYEAAIKYTLKNLI